MANKPKAKYWSVDKIRPIPNKLYKSVYGDDYNDNWELRPASLSESEKETLRPILKSSKFESIFLVPEIEKPQHIRTPDLLINGRRVEIKEVSSKRSIEKQTSKAHGQTGDDGLIIYDISRSQLSKTEIIDEITKRGLNKQIAGFIVSDKKTVVSVGFLNKEKTGYSSASYAANEGSLFLNSMLSQKPQNVNRDRLKPLTQTYNYWEERSIRRTLEAEHHGLSYLRQIYNVYSEASREITKQVQDIYIRYYKDKGFDVEALRELVPQGDILRLKEQIRELGLYIDLPDNYNARINRLEFLNLQMQVEINSASKKINKLMGKSLAETYKNSYYRTAYDTSKGIGEISNFSRLNTKGVRKVLSEKNYGKNFSERIWGRSQKLGNELKEIVGKAIATGQSHAKTSRLIRERFNVSKSSADRLVRTETNYYENQAELDSYKEMSIEKYQFIATIDTRTSEICQHLDKKVFRVKDATPGVNMPPMHPNCRSTITAYLGEEYEADTRIARNRRTNISEYIENMSYKEWLKQFSDLDTDISEDWAE